VRAPTAPQACWALEQHTDELAAAIGMDPVAFRKLNCIDTGDEGPTRQKYLPIGLQECIANAEEMSGYGQELPEDEAIGVAVGWWPCMPAPSGAYVQLNGDGSGTIITGAMESGTGAVMGLPILAAQVLGMQPEDFQILYQDTDAGPWDMGSSGSQTTFNNGRAVMAAATEVKEQLLDLGAEELEASRTDLELADGTVRVKGSPDRSVSIADLAGKAHGDQLLLGRGSGSPPEAPAAEAEGCVGRLGMESFLAPQLMTQAAHVKVDRETGVVRVLRVAAAHDCGTIINRIGAEGQVYGGVVMGTGQAITEGTQLDADGRQVNPHLLDYKLITASDAPQIDIAWVEIDTPNAGPNGGKGIGEPPAVPTSGAIGNAIANAIGKHVTTLPMTAERVWETVQEGSR
jgi:CO/xanthine dehydrogenase Mo-binding subunit